MAPYGTHMEGMAHFDSYIQTPSKLPASPPGYVNPRKGNMSKRQPEILERPTDDGLSSAIAIAGLLYFAEKFPHRQFTSAELSIVSGIGHTAMSQIRNADDTPFSLGKCTLRRLDAWLENHPGFKQS